MADIDEMIDIISKCESLVDDKIILLEDMERYGVAEPHSCDKSLRELYELKDRIISIVGEGK